MKRIPCGWCSRPTPLGECINCGRDPMLPWTHRGIEPRELEQHDAGRPALDERRIRQQYDEARSAIAAEGHEPTIDAIAERLDRSPRTIRDWRKRFAL